MASNWYTWPLCNHGRLFQNLPGVISCDSKKCSWFRVWPRKLVHPRRRSSIPYSGNTLRVWPGAVGPHNQQPLCGCSKLQRRHGKRVIIILPTPSKSSQTIIQNNAMSHVLSSVEVCQNAPSTRGPTRLVRFYLQQMSPEQCLVSQFLPELPTNRKEM